MRLIAQSPEHKMALYATRASIQLVSAAGFRVPAGIYSLLKTVLGYTITCVHRVIKVLHVI